MNKYEELVYNLIYNCNRELTTEEKKILNQASAIYNTYNNLTDELGCPLEIFVKLHNVDSIYDKYGKQYKINEVQGDVVMVDSELVYFSLNEYKKTWWLKEDKSE